MVYFLNVGVALVTHQTLVVTKRRGFEGGKDQIDGKDSEQIQGESNGNHQGEIESTG
jgi:hypothetical protein